MKVEKIEKLKSGKYKIKIDGEVITTYDDVILDNHLLFQKEISREEYAKIGKDSQYAEIYHKTLNYVLRKVRSSKEVDEFLANFKIPKTEIAKIKKRLEKNGLLSDLSYVKAYISDSLYLRNDGPLKIQTDLLAKGLDENIVLEEIAKIDDTYVKEKLEKLIQKRVSHDHKHSKYQLQQKILLDMIHLGYDRDMILSSLEQIEFSDNSQLEKEYDKCYQKFSRKYDGYDLERKIKEKLYSKGFDIHEIEAFIDKKKSETF